MLGPDRWALAVAALTWQPAAWLLACQVNGSGRRACAKHHCSVHAAKRLCRGFLPPLQAAGCPDINIVTEKLTQTGRTTRFEDTNHLPLG